MLEVLKAPTSPIYTVFVPFTRLWSIDAWLEHFNAIDLDRENTELVFFNDTNTQELHDKLYTFLESASNFNGATLYSSMKQPSQDWDLIERRRQAIVDMKKKSVELIGDSKYVFGLEDDSFAPPTIFRRLLSAIELEPTISIASGVELNRWAYPLIGAWKVSPLNDPVHVETVAYKESGLEEVDGVGWFSYLTYTNMYKDADYHWEAECIGPDVAYTLDLRRKGYKAVIDWDMRIEHKTTVGDYTVSEKSVVAYWDKEDGKLVFKGTK